MKFFPSSHSLQFIALIIILVIWSGETVRPPKTVIVNKCCAAGERLSENYECIIDSSDNWWPSIFMVLLRSWFEPRGNAPRFMKIHKQQPTCENPEFYIGEHKLALFSNGSLYLSEKHSFVEPQNYCIDRAAAIICGADANSSDLVQAKKLSKIRKCCVKNSVYEPSDNKCVSMNGFNFDYAQYDVVYGFPDCKVNKYFTISETFKASSFERESNRLILGTGRGLEWNDFCVEHVINNKIGLSVFTCADHLSISQNAEENSYTVIC